MVLALAGFLFYWHQTGLPNFVKNALLEALRHRGLDLQFQSLHFHWDRGLVARNVSFGRDQLVAGPLVTAGEVQIVLDAAAALQGRLQVNLLRLRDGQVIWRFVNTPQSTPPLEISHLQSELVIRDSVWELRQFNGEFLGAQFRIHGLISNAMAFSRQWAEAQTPATSGPSASARAHLMMRDFANALTNYQWHGERSAELTFSLDAMDWSTACLQLQAKLDGALTPWGYGEKLTLQAARTPQTSNPSHAAIQLDIGAALITNQWGRLENAHLTANTTLTTNGGWPSNLTATLQAELLQLPYLEADYVDTTLQVAPGQTNLLWQSQYFWSPWFSSGPLQCHITAPIEAGSNPLLWKIESTAVRPAVTNVGKAEHAEISAIVEWYPTWPLTPKTLQGQFQTKDWKAEDLHGTMAAIQWQATLPSNAMVLLTNSNLTFEERIEPLALQWHLNLSNTYVYEIFVEALETQGSWSAPILNLTNLQICFPSNTIVVSCFLNTQSSNMNARISSEGDLRALSLFLPYKLETLLEETHFEEQSRLDWTLATTLPIKFFESTNFLSALETLTSSHLTFHVGPASRDDFSISEMSVEAQWDGKRLQVPRLEARSGTNQLKARAQLTSDGAMETELQWHGLPDPLLPLFPTNALKALSLWKWRQPLELNLNLSGNWNQSSSWQATGEVRATQFAFKGEEIEALSTRFSYNSNVLAFHHPHVRRADGEATAEQVQADFNRQMVFLRQAEGVVDPMAVARMIGPHVVKTIAPYRFGAPVKAAVHGDIPMHGEMGAHVDFHLSGSPFQWWRFNASNLTASILWRDESVIITNLWTDFYGGRLRGDIFLDFSSHQHTDMQLRFSLSQIQFAGLMADISDRPNKVEGLLTGHLDAKARAEDWKSWNGFGSVALSDGLIWDIPIFGLFSPVLNAISPGLGNSRAREAKGTFIIRDSIIHTDDLVIQAAAYNLKYRGNVNFDYEVDARVEAEILRETKMLGPAISLFFKPFTKLFEYRVTGTLAEPKTKPVYIPGVVMKFLTPFRSLRELFQSDTKTPTAPPPPTAPEEEKK